MRILNEILDGLRGQCRQGSNLERATTLTSIGFASTRLPLSLYLLPLLILGALLLFLGFQRYLTKQRLQRCGIPTVYWSPRFFNYQSRSQREMLPSSTITNILPRMQRLQGPYGMYGTVYGLSTAVVHVAHPVPALALLSASSTSSSSSTTTRRRSSSRLQGSGACKAPAYNHFKRFCGNGVFTADGTDWKAKRAAVAHALLRHHHGSGGSGNSGTTTSWEAHVQAHAQTAARSLVQRLKRKCCTTTARNKQNHPLPHTADETIVNLLPLLQRTTVGFIFRYITHVDLETTLSGCHTGNTADDQSTASTVSSHESVGEEPADNDTNLWHLFQSYLASILHIRMIILAKSRSIWFLLPPWVYRWFSPMSREEDLTLRPIRQFAVLACQTAVPGSPLRRLQSLPLYQASGSDTKNNANDATSSIMVSQNLLDEAITLLFAGQDTSAATLSWTLHLLSLAPNVQQRLADEVHATTSDDNNNNNNKPRPYLDAVIKESMRLYPVAPFVVRRLPEAVTVTGDAACATTVPAHTVACVWIYSLHRHPDFWTDPDEFRPERWLHDPKDVGMTNGAYLPFAAGPRNCVGQPLAHIVLRTLLSELVTQFEFVDPRWRKGADTAALRKDMQAGFTVLPKDGVELIVRARKKA